MERPLRVLFIGHSATRTGAPIVLLNLMRWLRANSDIEVETVLPEDGPLRADYEALGPVTLLGRERVLKSRWGRFRMRIGLPSPENQALRQLARRRGFDLIYSNTITNGTILEALAPLALPTISHVHELDYWIERSGKRNWEAVTRRTTRYIAASDAVRRLLTSKYSLDPGRINLIYEAIPATSPRMQGAIGVRRSLGIPEGAPLVAGCGSEYWRKGKDLFVQVASQVLARTALPVYFVWVGYSGSEEERYWQRHDIERAGLADRVRLVGEVDNPMEIFAAGDLFVLPSRDDPFPLVCLEAASLSKPIVCFAGAGGMPEFVEDDAGLVVPYLNVSAMATGILELLQDGPKREALGRNAAGKVSSRHTFDTTGPLTAKLMREVADEHNGRAC